jgi:hypothetical protein
MEDEAEPPGVEPRWYGEQSVRAIYKRRQPPDIPDERVQHHVKNAAKGKDKAEGGYRGRRPYATAGDG